jgi:RHS repeat-associated protein
MQRPTHRYVSTNGAAEILLERSVYGEGLASANLCGRLFRQYDTGGVAISDLYDFKGNLVASTRQLAVEYRQSIDWSPLANLTLANLHDVAALAAALDAAAASFLVAADRFDTTTNYDALNRPIQMVTPHSSTMQPNVLRPSYSEANLLDQVDVWLQQAALPTDLLNPTTADCHAVTAIGYNARGQRTQLALGNGTITTYEYDLATFRLTHLTTTRPSTFAANEQVVQDLSYYYDPVGNITRIQDTADTQDVIYFQNKRVEPSSDYTYDPLYRLISATGREHLGQNGGALNAPQQVTNDDSFRTNLPQPGDGNAMGTYTETYTYDPVGNLRSMLHQVSSGSWTRHYAYTEPSQITPTETNNRLSSTSLPGDPASGPYSAHYTYDTHGNMFQMPHLPSLTWDEQDRLHSTTQQVVNAGTPETTYYTYDAGGQRLCKATDRQAQANQAATCRTERLYLGVVEIYREFAGDGTTVTLQRETLHVSVGPNRVALIETRTVGTDPGEAQLNRYQYANHLGSAALELDDQAQIISYEEYFPHGSTSYQVVRSQTETPKRYRYTGKERDEENGLYYHGARYYAPWLGRWVSCDPKGMVDGTNPFVYARNNPVWLIDTNGAQATPNQSNLSSDDKLFIERLRQRMEQTDAYGNRQPINLANGLPNSFPAARTQKNKTSPKEEEKEPTDTVLPTTINGATPRNNKTIEALAQVGTSGTIQLQMLYTIPFVTAEGSGVELGPSITYSQEGEGSSVGYFVRGGVKSEDTVDVGGIVTPQLNVIKDAQGSDKAYPGITGTLALSHEYELVNTKLSVDINVSAAAGATKLDNEALLLKSGAVLAGFDLTLKQPKLGVGIGVEFFGTHTSGFTRGSTEVSYADRLNVGAQVFKNIGNSTLTLYGGVASEKDKSSDPIKPTNTTQSGVLRLGIAF